MRLQILTQEIRQKMMCCCNAYFCCTHDLFHLAIFQLDDTTVTVTSLNKPGIMKEHLMMIQKHYCDSEQRCNLRSC